MGKSRNTDKYGKFRNHGNNKPRKNKGNKPERYDLPPEPNFDRECYGNPVMSRLRLTK